MFLLSFSAWLGEIGDRYGMALYGVRGESTVLIKDKNKVGMGLGGIGSYDKT